MAEPGDDDKLLRKIAQSFKELTAVLNSETADIERAPFSQACSLVLPLIGSLGIAFKFAEMDLAPKYSSSECTVEACRGRKLSIILLTSTKEKVGIETNSGKDPVQSGRGVVVGAKENLDKKRLLASFGIGEEGRDDRTVHQTERERI
ncbi:uncharacterized protein LOC115668465 [Syzygium oleosum]|uniref:uncharacterized protein LOC115668465 n=1 Tax=Syzygium oleosum TaxID=219896 RepID=UPI0011D1FF41|nr:uncharacterized protein LOC115668465 [Syzygium oleosum]